MLAYNLTFNFSDKLETWKVSQVFFAENDKKAEKEGKKEIQRNKELFPNLKVTECKVFTHWKNKFVCSID